MDATPKKLIESGEKCFLCAVTVLKSNKIFIFGKNSLDIAGLIDSAIDIGVPTSSTRALIG